MLLSKHLAVKHHAPSGSRDHSNRTVMPRTVAPPRSIAVVSRYAIGALRRQRICVGWRAGRCERSGMDSSVLEWLLAGIDRSGAVCVLDLDRSGVVELHADHVVQTGSAFKIAVCLEVY